MAPKTASVPSAEADAAARDRTAAERRVRIFVGDELGDRHAELLHRVAEADGHGVLELRLLLAERLEVHRHAERRADLVLAAVAAADGAGLVPRALPLALQRLVELARLGAERLVVLDEREHRDLDGRDGGREAQDGADVLLALRVDEPLLVVGVADEGEREAVGAGGGLDNVRDVLALEEQVHERLGVERRLAARDPVGDDLGLERGLLLVALLGAGEAQAVVLHGHRLAGELLVLREVEAPARGDALELLDAEGEGVLDVDAGAGVVRELLLGLPVQVQVGLGEAREAVPLEAALDPVLVPDLPAPVLLRLAVQVRLNSSSICSNSRERNV